MIGVVLCGGQSLRMGSDKGLLKNADGIFWAESACQKLAALEIPVVVSINRQQENYKKLLPKNQLIVDDASLTIKGPLLGLMSVHLQFPEEDIWLLACDMIDMKTEVLCFLFEQFKIEPCEAMVFSNAGFSEPLCGIYTSPGLKKIFSFYQKSLLPKHSMQHILRQLSTFQPALPHRWKNYFNNHNFPETI